MRLLASLKSTLLLAAVACVVSTSAHPGGDVSGLYALVKRRMPSHSNAFTFNLSTIASSDLDTFTMRDASHDEGDAEIYIECTTLSACARGLHAYVTEFGGVDIWWTGSRLDQLPHKLPTVNKPVTRSAIVPYRYFFNTVTFDYTAAFYTFDDWSLLLDWLALRGVNLPLAWVGYEYILVEVFREVGLTNTEIADFLSGPAFQAWNRFGNIQGSWGGDLPTQWIDDQFALQKQIISRMVELGMTPVLPSFTGFVPRASAQSVSKCIYRQRQSMVRSCSLRHTPMIHSSNPSIPFLRLCKSLSSTNRPPRMAASLTSTRWTNTTRIDPYSGDPTYLQNVSSTTFASLRAADPEAIWLMQGWLFFSGETFWTTERVQAYLGGIPGNDSMIILDLYSEAQPQQWVWCELHDFGGNMGFEGNFVNVTAEPLRALTSPGSSMVGMGLTPEGLEGNEIIYDVLLDQAWSLTAINRTLYVSSWVSRRYYVSDLPSSAVNAWEILGATVYSNQDPSSQAVVKSILELAPALSGLVNQPGPGPSTLLFYDTDTTIVPALQMLIQAGYESKSLLNIPEFKYDLVDVTRQLLANRFITLYETLVATYTSNASSSATIAAASKPLLQLLHDLDELLLTDDHFLLANWINAARSLSHGNASYAAFLEYNARNQITLWGPTGEINDYASKQWGGLVGGYYVPRWEAFIDYLVGTKENGTAYNATAVANTMLVIGEQWDTQTWGQMEKWGTVGDSWSVVQALATKYI
ncbi:glycoside hydrolase family 89 protein [Suillus ampliporus]|nr:glycoside hydrolase family 89 protein [Suillus ampliporus]